MEGAKKYPLDVRQMAQYQELLEMKKILEIVSRPRLFGLLGPSLSAIREAVSLASNSQAAFWHSIVTKWPQLRDENLSANAYYVWVNEDQC